MKEVYLYLVTLRNQRTLMKSRALTQQFMTCGIGKIIYGTACHLYIYNIFDKLHREKHFWRVKLTFSCKISVL
jgi:hypothetical protein